MLMFNRVMLEAAMCYFLAGDLNVEIELFCMEDGNDVKEICGPQCW